MRTFLRHDKQENSREFDCRPHPNFYHFLACKLANVIKIRFNKDTTAINKDTSYNPKTVLTEKRKFPGVYLITVKSIYNSSFSETKQK